MGRTGKKAHTGGVKLSSLSGRKTCDFLLRKGTTWKGKFIIVRWLPGAPRKPNIDPAAEAVYMGTFASTKLSKLAVERNRMRRRCRESFRLALKDRAHFGPVQLLVCPRIASLESPFPMVLAETQAFLSSLPSWPTPRLPKNPPDSSSSR
jgi:ribonuclease P protein component